MSNAKATHIGTCQVCGRSQKLPNDRLSKHGYTKEWGFFNGVCPGAHHLPFEVSIDQIESAIASAKRNREEVELTQKKLRTPLDRKGKAMGWVQKYVSATWQSRKSYYLDKEVEVIAVEVPYSDGTGSYFAFHYLDGDKQVKFQSFSGHRSAHDLADSLNETKAKRLDKNISELTRYINWQTGRITGWKAHPENLKPVK